MKIIHLNILIHQNMYLDNFEEECTFSDLLKGIALFPTTLSPSIFYYFVKNL